MSAKATWRADRGSWYLVIHRDGRKIQRKYGPMAGDKRRAERDAAEWNRKRTRGQLGLDSPRRQGIPFDRFAAEWLRGVELPMLRGLDGALSRRTYRLHDQVLRLHLAPHFGATDVRGIDVDAVDRLWAALLEKRQARNQDLHLSGRTVAIVLTTLRLILAAAVARGLLAANPLDTWRATRSVGRRARQAAISDAKVLTAEERERLLDAFRSEARHYYPLVLFLAETGARISEGLALNWESLDLDSETARLYREKTGGQATDVELSARICGALRELRAQRLRAAMRSGRREGDPLAAGLVFKGPRGGIITAESFRHRHWNPVVARALPGRRVTPHCLRHTWASLHLARGTPLHWIQQQGGWASAKMLLDTYGHFVRGESHGYADRLATPKADPGGPRARSNS